MKEKLSRKQKKWAKRNCSLNYILTKSGKVVPLGPIIGDFTINLKKLKKWGRFFKQTDRRTIGRDEFAGDIVVSTVFLGVNHGFLWNGPPKLFETMVFGGELDKQQWRYSTVKQARRGHRKVLELVTGVESAIVHNRD